VYFKQKRQSDEYMPQTSVDSRGDDIDGLLEDAYSSIQNHSLDEAANRLEEALSVDFDNDEVVSSLKFVNFWRDVRSSAGGDDGPFERGESLLQRWKQFEGFVSRVGSHSERAMNALRQHVYGAALGEFEGLLGETNGRDAELLLRVGRCFKGLGDYGKALEQLEQASRIKRDDSEVLAELADCYALVNEVAASKAFFREAFFIDPQKIDLQLLESEMIRRLVAKVRELGYEGPALHEWIPVYGLLYGVFNVKRELRSIEYGKLRQSIYTLEREVHSDEGRRKDAEDVLVPRLINRYFWLIDHYVNAGEDRAKIEEILMKIRELHSSVYQEYTH
jgi:tetratricopeptide (TPR) repeat protein